MKFLRSLKAVLVCQVYILPGNIAGILLLPGLGWRFVLTTGLFFVGGQLFAGRGGRWR